MCGHGVRSELWNKLTPESGIMGICQGCHAGCCRSFAIPINGADMMTLERETGKTFWDFGCRWEDPEGSIAADYAPHFFFQDEPQTPFVICLKHEQSRIFKKSTCCSFLKETPPDKDHPLGQSQCGIYHARPSACRVFPTKFDVENELPIIHPVPEYGREDHQPEFKLCPRQWTPADVDPINGTSDLVIARYEARFFKQIAKLWNQKVGPWSVFPDFIRNVYQNRVQPISEEAFADEEPYVLKMSAYDAQKRRCA